MESPPSPTPVYRIGDRVRLIALLPDVAMDSIGTIVSQFLGGSLYDVRFDGQSALRVVGAEKLVALPRESSRR